MIDSVDDPTGASDATADPALLHQIYDARFEGRGDYRNEVWRTLIGDVFARWIPAEASVVDVGCGHGEFINNVPAKSRSAMDLNPATKSLLDDEVVFYEQDCTANWPLTPASQDVVFSSNFIEHLPSKDHVIGMFRRARQALKPDGALILLGPNLRYVGGRYWDFFDHHVPLTDRSVVEALQACGFTIDTCIPRILPYTMSAGREYPVWILRTYLKIPVAWRLFGEQFLIVARPE